MATIETSGGAQELRVVDYSEDFSYSEIRPPANCKCKRVSTRITTGSNTYKLCYNNCKYIRIYDNTMRNGIGVGKKYNGKHDDEIFLDVNTNSENCVIIANYNSTSKELEFEFSCKCE